MNVLQYLRDTLVPARAIVALGCGVAVLVSPLVTAVARAQDGGKPLSVFTTRERALIEPLLKVFEELTQIKITATFVKDDLASAVRAGIEKGSVDLLVASEFGQLIEAKDAGLTQPANSKALVERVPAAYRDAANHWFGLTSRVRTIAASRERVGSSALTYEELADPKWKGKICVRSGRHPYNIYLVASLIAHKGANWTQSWLQGLKANLARKPTGGDRDQFAAVHAGVCDVALVNSYYIGDVFTDTSRPEQPTAASRVKVIFPNQADRGAHVSISGMGLAKNAPNAKGALLLMDFMTSEPAQFIYAKDNHEYPIRADVKSSSLVESWGTPKLDAVSLDKLGALGKQALDLIEKTGFDQ